MAGFGLAGMGALLTGDDIAGATASTLGSDAEVFGKKPKVSKYKPIDLSEEIAKTTTANLANADSITAFLEKLMPGFSSILKKGLETSGALVSGQIPQDVQDQVMRSDAFQSLMGGFQGTGMSRALTARDLGRTSLDLMQAGQNSAQQWAKLAETSYDPFIIKTMQQAGTTAANNAGTQASEQAQFNVDAAPDPAAAAKFAIDSAIGMQMLSFGLGAAGGAIGGAGGAAAVGANNTGGGGYRYNPQTGTYEQVPANSVGYTAPVWGGA